MNARFDVPNEPAINGEYNLINTIVSSGVEGSYVDVGANRGEWTFNIMERAKHISGKAPTCICIEPNPSMAACLRQRFANYPNVRVFNVALSDHYDEAPFYVAPGNGGTSSLYCVPENVQETGVVTVTTFDALMPKTERFALVKIDAEGADPLILKGMKNVFSERRIAACQFEYNSRWRGSRTTLRDTFHFAREVGYHFGKLTTWGSITLHHWNDEIKIYFEANYLLLRPDVAEQLRVQSLE